MLGPYGDPNRFDLWSNGNMTVWQANEGEFPRTISLFRTSYSTVAEARVLNSDYTQDVSWQRVWVTQYAPDTSTYVPMYISAEKLPPAFTSGTMHVSIITQYVGYGY